MSLHSSGEMYLESIFVLRDKIEGVHAIDVSEYMGFSKPSVSRALKLLKADGYIDIDAADHITLTPAGERIAKKIFERHTILTQVLLRLGVDEVTAADDACKIEHDISDATFEAIKNYIEKEKSAE